MRDVQAPVSFLTRLSYWIVIVVLRFIVLVTNAYIKLSDNRIGLVPKTTVIRPTRKTTINSSKDASRTILIHIHEPPSLPHEHQPLPVLINFHGSAFVLPNIGYDAEYCTHLAAALGCVVLDADYAKGPEYRYPAAVEDARDVLAYVQADRARYDTARIAIGGYSAGATIALLVATQAPPGTIKSVIAWFPVTDFSLTEDERPCPPLPKGVPGTPLSADALDMFSYAWLPCGQDVRDPQLSLAFVPASAFPPVTFIVGKNDSLCGEVVALAEKLSANDVDTRIMTVPNAGHGWGVFAKPGTPQREALVQAVVLVVKRLRAIF